MKSGNLTRLTSGLRRRTAFAALLSAALIPTACAATSPVAVTAAHPCAGAVPRATFSHVVIVLMENKDYGQIIGSKSAPYINGLAKACGLATQYHGITYPSLPNYLAVTSGSAYGIHDDNGPAAHPIGAASIFSQVGASWQSLSESMPVACGRADAYPYMVKHNPAPYYTSLKASCAAHSLPLPSAPTFSARYTFVTPNMVHDMHDGTVAQGDAWLKTFVPKVINSAGYRANSTLLVITWDTDSNAANANANRAPAIIVAPQVKPGTSSAIAYNHYSLLRLSEEALGLPLLAGAKSAHSMVAAFHI
jgi:phosphatidylinositol-3-phosphatase